MPKQEGQKSKLLALLRIFEQQTDENHLLNVPQLVELLEAQGIRCERKSVYSDIEALGALGYDIKLRRGRGGGYFLASRTFDLAELKLLVDAVQASRVVSGTTSRRLIHKLEKLCSNYEGSQLQRQVYVEGRPKTDSKSLLYSIDALHEAINNGKMVEFLYRKADSREKEKRIVSPWQLAWENGCYYLIAFADEKGIRHYRVDKMSGVRVLDAPRRGQEQFADLDLPAYLRKHFGMYGGPEHRVTLRCTADLEGAMRERFGATPMFLPEEDGSFHFDVPICVSDQFYGWVCGFGGKIEVVAPRKCGRECGRWPPGWQNSINNKKDCESSPFCVFTAPSIPDHWAGSDPARRQVQPQGGGSGGRWPFPVCCGQGGHCRRCGHRQPASGHNSPAGARCSFRPDGTPCSLPEHG